MIAKDNMPLSTTEKPGFIYFMRKTASLYKIPSRKVVTNLVKSKYQVLSSLVKSRLSNVEYMTITADIWTDIINTTSFLGMTIHFLIMSKDSLDSVTIGVLELADSHNANNICEWFEQILKEWGIQKHQVLTVVTDSGANILSAVKKTFGNDHHLPCFAHTLNLVTQRPLSELPDIQNIISKIKTIVTFFKQSVSANDKLKKVCDLKLKQSVPTRWNSIYYMIDRFLLCSNHIASILITIRRGPSMLSADEIDIAKEINLILKSFEAATKELCGENYITGSKVISLIHCLIKNCEKIVVNNSTVVQLKSALLDNLQRRFGRMEEIQMLSIAILLDPRFKTLHSNDAVAVSKAISTIRLKILDFKTNSSGSNKDSSDDDTEQADNLWSFHKELVSKKASENSEENNERMPTDLKHFLNQPTIPLQENIFQFWKVHRIMYPHIAKIAEPYLSLVATSVPSERLFSKAGNIMTAKRNRLKGTKLQQLLFLNSLSVDDWHLK